MRYFFALLVSLSFTAFAQLDYDTIIDRGIYKSYFNSRIKQPIAVVYKLYHGGGDAPRSNDRFVTDSLVKTLKNKDYAKSGYDKGHLVPAEDFAFSDSLQNLTFRFYNCVPQHPKLNRGKWKKYEALARKLSQKDTVIIVCYNYFKPDRKKTWAVPGVCYKAVFDKAGHLLFKIGIENTALCKDIAVNDTTMALIKRFIVNDPSLLKTERFPHISENFKE